jgi:hypothetical protein
MTKRRSIKEWRGPGSDENDGSDVKKALGSSVLLAG